MPPQAGAIGGIVYLVEAVSGDAIDCGVDVREVAGSIRSTFEKAHYPQLITGVRNVETAYNEGHFTTKEAITALGYYALVAQVVERIQTERQESCIAATATV